MKIIKYGIVILTEKRIQVEGWQVEREASDPEDATSEELLLEVTIPWAQHKLNDAIAGELRKVSKMRKEASERLLQN